MTGIVDAHHHIWRQMDLPWLSGPMQPRIFGPYEPIRRDYPVGEYIADIAGSGVTRSVYVQANWAKDRFEDEVAWVSGRAASHGWPHAIVGYADLSVEDARWQFDRLARHPLMRGVRMQLHWHDNPQYRFAPRPDLVADPAVVRNAGYLADYGWSFDLQVFSGQMADAALLAEACPNVTFVLQHAGMLENLSADGRARWARGMDRLALRPNVMVKLSGLGTFVHAVDGELIAGLVEETVARFGAERCLWGSNFPIEKLWTSYADLIAAHRAAAAPLGAAAETAIFETTATRVYRLAD
jgi:predicted TIM-barrel fold metal-dependent hydrolase